MDELWHHGTSIDEIRKKLKSMDVREELEEVEVCFKCKGNVKEHQKCLKILNNGLYEWRMD